MITCLGLIVGNATANIDDILRKMSEHVKKYHLPNKVPFEINNVLYATLYDTHTAEDGSFWCLFDTMDGVKGYVINN